MSPNLKVPNVKLNNEVEVPIIGLGTWRCEPDEAGQAIKDAIDIGYRHFDCAMIYSNEQEIGEAFKAKIDDGTVKRDELFVTSKLWNTCHRPDLVVDSCKTSVKDLGLGYLDLYLIHWPTGYKEGRGRYNYKDVDYVDTWPSMEKCVELGLVRTIGISNFNIQQMQRILDVAKIKPAMNQIECHPWLNQKELIDFCKSKDIAVTAYGPLGFPYKGLPKRGAMLLDDPKLKEIAHKHNKTVAQVLLRFQIERGVIVIPKTVKKSRLEENISIFDFELTTGEMEEIYALNCNRRFCHLDFLKDHPHYPFDCEKDKFL